MRKFIAYLDRFFIRKPRVLCADTSSKNIIDCGFFRHLDSLPVQSTGASQLLPSASFSAPARIEPAQPFRICRHTLSISLDYFVAGSTDH